MYGESDDVSLSSRLNNTPYAINGVIYPRNALKEIALDIAMMKELLWRMHTIFYPICAWRDFEVAKCDLKWSILWKTEDAIVWLKNFIDMGYP